MGNDTLRFEIESCIETYLFVRLQQTDRFSCLTLDVSDWEKNATVAAVYLLTVVSAGCTKPTF